MGTSDTIENSFILRDHEHFSLKIRQNRKYWLGEAGMKTLIDLKVKKF